MSEWTGRLHGEPISRQPHASMSLITPTSISGYSDFFRMNSKMEDGWLDLKIGKSKSWERYWVIYDNDVIMLSKEQHSHDPRRIAMSQVRSLRADNSGCTISIATSDEKIQLKMQTMDDMNRWLFAFQKSVARVLTSIIEKRSRQVTSTIYEMAAVAVSSSSSTTAEHHDGAEIMRNASFARMDSTVVAGATRAYTDEDVAGRSGGGLRINVPDFESSPRPPSSGRILGETPRFSSTPLSTVGSRGGGSVAGSFGAVTEDCEVPEAFGLSDSLLSLSQKNYIPPTKLTAASSYASSHNSWQGAGAIGTGTSPCIAIIEMGASGQRAYMDREEESADKISSSFKDPTESVIPGIVLERLNQVPTPQGSPRQSCHHSRSRTSSASSDAASPDTSRASESGAPHDFGFFGDLDENMSESGSIRSRSDSLAKKHASPPQPIQSNTPTRRPSNTSGGSRVGSLTDHMERASLGEIGCSGGNGSARTSPRLPPARLIAITSGSCSVTGQRKSNEDRFVCIPDLRAVAPASSSSSSVDKLPSPTPHPAEKASNTKSSLSGMLSVPPSSSSAGAGTTSESTPVGPAGAMSYYGVYDGHSGAHTAAYVHEHLHHRIYSHSQFRSNIEAAISESCIETDKDVLQQCKEKKWFSGTTAIGAFIVGSKLTVYNIGDCQAVLSYGGQPISMNSTHSPGREDEKLRIESAGAWVTEEQNYDLERVRHMDLDIPFIKEKAKEVKWVTVHRVCGEIAVSRSIGDPDYKNFTPGKHMPYAFCWPEGHDQILHADPVIPNPEFVHRELTKEDEFLVIACDGLWDVVSEDEAVAIVRHELSKQKDPQLIAKELCSLALKLGSEDNVTIIIIVFTYHS